MFATSIFRFEFDLFVNNSNFQSFSIEINVEFACYAITVVSLSRILIFHSCERWRWRWYVCLLGIRYSVCMVVCVYLSALWVRFKYFWSVQCVIHNMLPHPFLSSSKHENAREENCILSVTIFFPPFSQLKSHSIHNFIFRSHVEQSSEWREALSLMKEEKKTEECQ